MKGTVSLHSCKRVTGGSGAEPTQEVPGGRFLSTGAKDLAWSGSRAALGIFGCSGWRSGGLPELLLGSPKVILELPEPHFGLSEGHF